MGPKKVTERIVIGIRRYFRKSGKAKAVVGMSGGIDSTLTAMLACKALGRGNLTGILMPEQGVSSAGGSKDAEEFAKSLGIKYYMIPINPFLKAFKELGWRQSSTASMNVRARIRAAILYNYANSADALVLGTSNKSELLLGYFTKYGDSASDLLPLGSLWKTEVRALAEYNKLPANIIEKAPSAELSSGQTDERELGAPYEQLDPLLDLIEQGAGRKEIEKKGFGPTLISSIFKRIKENEHKRHTAAAIKA